MPVFRDNRKGNNNNPKFNGWCDDNEPRSPLADLFSKLVPTLATLKKKGALMFPPPPPHAELPPAASKIAVAAAAAIGGGGGGNDVLSVDAHFLTKKDRPVLSDYACESRQLGPVEKREIAELAARVGFRLSTDTLKPTPPLEIEDSAHFAQVIKANVGKLILVDFFATWCAPCRQLSPVLRLVAMSCPTVLVLKVDIDECDDLASEYQIKSMPTLIFLRALKPTATLVFHVSTLTDLRAEIERTSAQGVLLVIVFTDGSQTSQSLSETVQKISELNYNLLRVVRVSTALLSIEEEEDDAEEMKKERADLVEIVTELNVSIFPAAHIFDQGTLRERIDSKVALISIGTKLREMLLDRPPPKQKVEGLSLIPEIKQLATINGGGSVFEEQFKIHLEQLSTPEERLQHIQYTTRQRGNNTEAILKVLATSQKAVTELATLPLEMASSFVQSRSRVELGWPLVDPTLAFDVSGHDAAKTKPAIDVLDRFKEDVKSYATYANQTPVLKFINVTDTDIHSFFQGDLRAEAVLKEALSGVIDLMAKLQQIRDADALMIQDSIRLLEKASNHVSYEASDDKATKCEKMRFALSRLAGQNSFVWTEFLFGTLLSSRGEEDLTNLNPYLSSSTAESIFNLTTVSMLRTNR